MRHDDKPGIGLYGFFDGRQGDTVRHRKGSIERVSRPSPFKRMQGAENGVVLQFCRDGVERGLLVFYKPVDEQVQRIRCALREDEMVRFLCMEKTGKCIPGCGGIIGCCSGC